MNIHSISWMALHLFSARSIAQPSPRQVVRIESDAQPCAIRHREQFNSGTAPPDIESSPGEVVAIAILCHIVMRTSTKVKTMEALARWLNERTLMMIHPPGNAWKYQVLCASSVNKHTRFRLRTERRSMPAGLAFFQTNFYPSTRATTEQERPRRRPEWLRKSRRSSSSSTSAYCSSTGVHGQ
jgi:hypothetical protein